MCVCVYVFKCKLCNITLPFIGVVSDVYITSSLAIFSLFVLCKTIFCNEKYFYLFSYFLFMPGYFGYICTQVDFPYIRLES